MCRTKYAAHPGAHAALTCSFGLKTSAGTGDLCRAADTNQSAAPARASRRCTTRRPVQNPHECDTNARAAQTRSIFVHHRAWRGERPTGPGLELLEGARADNFSLDMDSVTAA